MFLVPSWNRAGGESVVKNLIENFPQNGYEIHLLCLTDEITAPIPKGCHFHKGYGLPIDVKNNKLKISLKVLIQTIALIKKIQPDVTHYHLIEGFHTIIIPIISSFCKNKNVVTIHTRKNYYYLNGLKNILLKNIERWIFTLSRAIVIAVSKIEYNFLQRIFNTSRLICINNGIDVDFFSTKNLDAYTRENFGLSDNDFIAVIVARLSKVKNQELAIKALPVVLKSIPSVKLLLVGKRGDQEENYKKLVKNLKLEQNVIFLGEFDDVRPIYNISNLGLLISTKEGLSITLLEMMSMGLPVILSDIPEFRNLFPKHNNIPFVDPYNPEQLAKVIIDLYYAPAKMKSLGAFLREYAEKEFSIDKQVEKHVNLYKKLIGGKI